MTDTPGSRMLTKTLLTVIREQRHHGTRVIISTQEPTIDTRLMDLSSATIIHRFTSPKWFDELRKHISVKGDESDEELFDRIVNLRVGEALMYAPSAMVEGNDGTVGKLGAEVITVGVRQRITWDGGRSVFAV